MMNPFKQLPGFTPIPAGAERMVLRWLPKTFLFGTLARKFHWPAKEVILDGDLDGWRGLGGVLPKY